MFETIEIGSSPCSENCVQIGQANYREQALKECRAFINQLRREFGIEPEGATLFIKSNKHDFGVYLEAAVKFDDSNEAATNYAFNCETGKEQWDDEAKKELGINN